MRRFQSAIYSARAFGFMGFVECPVILSDARASVLHKRAPLIRQCGTATPAVKKVYPHSSLKDVKLFAESGFGDAYLPSGPRKVAGFIHGNDEFEVPNPHGVRHRLPA